MKYCTLAKHVSRTFSPDKIHAASKRALKAIEEFGEEHVINATLGECIDDNGELMALQTVEDILRAMPITEICKYAPIYGIPEFNDAVKISFFGEDVPDYYIEAIPTPGACGALRHAIWNFLDDGEAALTTDWFWSPYRGICEEHNRFLETFEMFNDKDEFNIMALDKKIEELLRTQNNILLIINTPAHNPTGYSMTTGEVLAVVDIIKKYAKDKTKQLTLCLDVSYIDYDVKFEKTREIFKTIKDMPENTMVTIVFSMSKSYTISGIRCGALVCMAKTKEAALEFKNAMTYSSRAVWSSVIRAAQRVLADICLNSKLKDKVDSEREAFKRIISERGNTFIEEAKKCGLKCCAYKNGFFIAIPCKNPGLITEKLASENIFVVPLEKGLRFSTCAVQKPKCQKASKVIEKVISEFDY